MSTSFIAGGFMTLVTALAVTLGANVGTTLIVQVLTFNVAAFAPVFVLAGLIAFNRGGKTRTRDLGRVSIGIGLILLALHLIIATIQPVEKAKALRELFAMLSGDPIIDMAIAALLTWAAYSSVAVVLLIMTLAAQHIVRRRSGTGPGAGRQPRQRHPAVPRRRRQTCAQAAALGNLIVRGRRLPGRYSAAAVADAGDGRAGSEPGPAGRRLPHAVQSGARGHLHRSARPAGEAVHAADACPAPRPTIRAGRSTSSRLVRGAPSLALADAAREVLRMVDIVEVHAAHVPGGAAERRPQAAGQAATHG